MSFFKLLELGGVNPKADRPKVVIWVTSTMVATFLASVMTGLMFASNGNLVWFLVPIGVFFIGYRIGRHYDILESGRNRSGLKDVASLFFEMDTMFVDRNQPNRKFVFWRIFGFLIAIAFTGISTRLIFVGGNPLWLLTIVPVYIVFYLIGRRFGHFR